MLLDTAAHLTPGWQMAKAPNNDHEGWDWARGRHSVRRPGTDTGARDDHANRSRSVPAGFVRPRDAHRPAARPSVRARRRAAADRSAGDYEHRRRLLRP